MFTVPLVVYDTIRHSRARSGSGYFFGSARNFADPSADEVALIHYNTTSLDVAQSDTIWWSHGSASAKTRFLRSHILDLAFCGQKTYRLQKSLIFNLYRAPQSVSDSVLGILV